MDGLLQVFSRLGLVRLAAMAVIAVLMLGFFAFLIMRASAPSLAPLYTGLSFEDSAAIVNELQTQNVTYELRGEGDTILVPRDQITQIRMSLAENGLPEEKGRAYLAPLFAGLAETAHRAGRHIDFIKMSRDFATKGGLNEQVFRDFSDKGGPDALTEALDRVLKRIAGH